MILDQIVNFKRYQAIHTNITAALEFIHSHRGDESMPDGKYEIIANEVTAYVISKDTIEEGQADMEIHKQFMDIHYMLKGKEKCCLANLPENIESYEYDEAADITFFECQSTCSAILDKGQFCAVWPYEPHKPLCNAKNGAESVKKIICKVKISSKKQ